MAVLQERRTRVKTAIANLPTALEAGGDVASLVATLRERDCEHSLIEAQIRKLKARRREQNPQIVDDTAWQQIIAWVRDGLAGDNQQQRRRILESLIQRIDLWPGRDGVTIVYTLAPGSGLQVVSPLGIEPRSTD